MLDVVIPRKPGRLGGPGGAGPRTVDPHEEINWFLMGAVLIYTGWLVMTPYYRFTILDTIHFERLLMLASLVAVFSTGRIVLARGKLSVLLVVFLFVLYLSHFFGPAKYAQFQMVTKWTEDYWKLVVLYFVITSAIHNRRALSIYALGCLAILTFYWSYSMFDYSRGGSYVWQQGVPRLVGVWIPREVGAANFTGVVGVLMIPFAVYCADVYPNWRGRLISLVTLGVAIATVVLSGTRGALIASLALLLWVFRRQLLQIKWLAVASLVVVIMLSVLPPQLTARYMSVVSSHKTDDIDAFAQRQAEESAESRIEGLQDGFHLFLKRPILGYGPGSSALARAEVSDIARDANLELHNLYGQVMGETGFIGTALFLSMIGVVWFTSRRGEKLVDAQGKPLLMERAQARMIGSLLIGNLFYGLVAHSLYRFYWIPLFAMAQSYLAVMAASRTMNATPTAPAASGPVPPPAAPGPRFPVRPRTPPRPAFQPRKNANGR